MILWRIFHFLSFNTNPRFPPFLLYVRCKSRVTSVRRCFRDARLWSLSFRNGTKVKHDLHIRVMKTEKKLIRLRSDWTEAISLIRNVSVYIYLRPKVILHSLYIFLFRVFMSEI